MDVPEYLDLDEIDFSDDIHYASKNIPELCRRHDGQSEERQAPAINWARSAPSHSGAGIKPTGIADVYSKFRPVKRVSPLKHQPEVSETDADGKSGEQNAQVNKDDDTVTDVQGLKSKVCVNGAVFGELEHYDLDMDEILDVPYIKSSQQMATLPRLSSEKRSSTELCHGVKGSSLTHTESFSGGTQFCVLSPVNWPDMRKSKSVDQDHLRTQAGGFEHSPNSLHATETDRLVSGLPFPDTPTHKAGADSPGSQTTFPLQGGKAAARQDKSWGAARAFGECDDETKKNHNIMNIVREGQISLLPHFAAENLERIRDEDRNNLLHISAAQGHADCLQHLTSLMGEDCLNERNEQQLTPAGLAVRNGHLECVRWMVSETEAIAELSCTREHPSLIHYAARYGQERVLLWLLQFMQEQAIFLDEVDQNGNTAVHVAAQYGHLTCVQTLVEYGSNVTVQNHQSERPSQCAEHQGHSTCSRYLVVVETCMSLASQVVKLTKQLQEQTTARVALQSKLQLVLHGQEPNGSAHAAAAETWPEMTLTAEVAADNGQWILRQRHVDADAGLRKGAAEGTSGVELGAGPVSGTMRRLGVAERQELKLARLKQIMQRSLSESDSDAYPQDESKHSRPERPTHLPIAEAEEPPGGSQLMVKHKHKTSKSTDVYNPSPSSDNSDPDRDAKTYVAGESPDRPKVTTSPKSALKSPTSRRKTSQNLKLRVTFDEPPRKDGPAADVKVTTGKEKTESGKRPFGTFRSIMETLSGNQSSNNNTPTSAGKQSNAASAQSPAGKKSESKSKNKPSAV
ncbi:synphilin-1-like [Xyrauchen texanus]|uniref:synphilin-1-like n=1 Tax=Xyrauchen texanus TaxID=154827 RepID=UPI0022419326|nr:synphilin-1-like [Xyrauchen texanus]XP_051949902.1 synphilin-1-like [Xyrauchen texanus]